MLSLSILIAQADGRVGDLLASNLHAHFREIHRVGLKELRERCFRNEAPQAVVVDLELVNFQELQEICTECGNAAVICTHRLADEQMWVAALAAGATDCCTPDDIAGILRAARGTLLYKPVTRAA